MTNCEVGDIALLKTGGIVGGEAFTDRLVEVIASVGVDSFFGQLWSVKSLGWVPGPHLVALSPGGTFVYPDSLMRPIRNRPGEDETIAWAGRPHETPAELIKALSK